MMDAALFSGGRDPSAPETRLDPEHALAETRRHWRTWIGRFDERRTRWPEVVKRSLITLKAMAHHVTGGLVAAPTTGLPELAGGDMNWDYRYCWLRDASFTLGAFVNAGFTEEATAWRDWLLRAVGGAPEKMQIMYRLDGGRHLDEYKMEELPGYRDARPVLIGNAAAKQHQIDVYGEVLDCLDFARRAGIPITPHHIAVERRIVDHLEQVWTTPGSGVWESRGHPRQYTYSKAMAWAGFDRAVRDGGSFEDDAPERLAHLRALRDKVHAAAEPRGLERGPRHLHPGLRQRDDRREPAADAARRLPARRRAPHGGHHRQGSARSCPRGADPAHEGQGGRPERGRLPAVLLLDGGLPRPAGSARGGRGPVRAAARGRQRPRALRGGIQRARPSTWPATSPRR